MTLRNDLNILNIGPTPPRIGGSPLVNIETLIGLAQRGHSVRCISQLSPEDLASDSYDISWRGTGVEVYPVEAPFIPSSERLSDTEIERRRSDIIDTMDGLVAEEKPDAIMVGHESYAAYANETARKMGIPIVQVLHGTPTTLVDDGTYPPDLTDQFLNAINNATLVVGVSNYLSNVVRRRGIKQTTYIHNGTDTSHFKPSPQRDESFLSSLGLKLGDTVVMHASTLRPVKRPLDIVESARSVIDHDPSVHYVIVGDGPLRTEMEQRTKELGVSEHFRFVGSIDYQDIPPYFQNADIFLLPSQREGFGRVLREAQACRSVPVASDLNATREVIEHGRTGYLFERGNIKGLAQTVINITESDERRTAVADEGLRVASQNDMSYMINQYENALENPLGYLEVGA